MTKSQARKQRERAQQRADKGKPVSLAVGDHVEVTSTWSSFYGVVGQVTGVGVAGTPNQDRYTLNIGGMRGLEFRGSHLRKLEDR